MKPWCHNRPERSGARWEWTGRVTARVGRTGTVVMKLHYRLRQPFADINACHAYDEPPGTLSTAARRGYDCAGCRWLPEHVR